MSVKDTREFRIKSLVFEWAKRWNGTSDFQIPGMIRKATRLVDAIEAANIPSLATKEEKIAVEFSEPEKSSQGKVD